MFDQTEPQNDESRTASDNHAHDWTTLGFVMNDHNGMVPTDWCRTCWVLHAVLVTRPMEAYMHGAH